MWIINLSGKSVFVFYFLVFSFFVVITPFLTARELETECPISNQNNQKLIALILARGGSKGIKYKNLAKISNVTLLGNALRIAKNCHNCFSEIWVSTDNQLIANEAYHYNVSVHFRSEYSARDEATSLESIQEFLNVHTNFQNIALIQCTSVFVREQYLEAAVQLFKENSVDCVFSVQRSWKLRWKEIPNTDQILAINFNPKKRPRRQDWNGEFIETGMFYFMRRHLIEEGLLQNERCKFVEISARHALEIDDYYQLTLANILFNIPDW